MARRLRLVIRLIDGPKSSTTLLVFGNPRDEMLDQGIKMMGTDAVTFDPPIWAMFERQQFGKRTA